MTFLLAPENTLTRGSQRTSFNQCSLKVSVTAVLKCFP
jgi:hypothetical protein